MKQLDGENTKKSKEVEELVARVAADEENEEEARRVSFGLKQKIVATEASKEQALKEVKHNRKFVVCRFAKSVKSGGNFRFCNKCLTFFLFVFVFDLLQYMQLHKIDVNILFRTRYFIVNMLNLKMKAEQRNATIWSSCLKPTLFQRNKREISELWKLSLMALRRTLLKPNSNFPLLKEELPVLKMKL